MPEGEAWEDRRSGIDAEMSAKRAGTAAGPDVTVSERLSSSPFPLRLTTLDMPPSPRLSDRELAAINAAAVTREYNVKPHLGEDLRCRHGGGKVLS